MHKFEEIYNQLNEKQKEAVDSIDGPLLVLAGPGTGKTQLLSARVANILVKTDTSPANIVCLTFTVNAASNMRERLRTIIGSSANHVVIKTFHSLAADIIASHPEHFYAGAVLNPVTEIASQEMMLSILDSLPHDNPLTAKFDGNYVHLGNALEAIGRAKDAGLTPEKLVQTMIEHAKELSLIEQDVVDLFSEKLSHKTLEDLLNACEDLATRRASTICEGIARLVRTAVEQDLPTGKTTQTGKLKTKLISTENGVKVMQRERRANVWWQALAEVYAKYQAMLYKRGYMDYSDMLIGVTEVLEQNEDLRYDLQESIQYLLIDEFQDSNEAQIKLMHLLVDNPHIDSPNVMVVGDPNQTIYGFNGAMLHNTTDFRLHYQKSLTTVDLIENYRSSQAILDDARQTITPYSDFHPDLVAKNEPESTEIQYTSYATDADQAVMIRQRIQNIFTKDPKATVAVLARSHTSLAYLAQYLIKNKLTVNYEQNIDVRTTSCNELIINILSLIQAIISGQRQNADYYLSLLLRHPAFGLDPNVTWQIAVDANRTTSWLEQSAKHPATQPIIQWIQKLVAVAASEQLHVLIEQLLSLEFTAGKTLYDSLYTDSTAEQSIIEAQATRQLIELAKQYAQTDHVNLPSFLSMLHGTSDKLFRFSPSTGHYEHAVTLTTVHGAKGLEFDHVFVIDADEGNWKPKSLKYPIPLNLPVHINLDTPADYARLMYVALTRAKQGLYVSYVQRMDSKTTALPTEQLAHKGFVPAKPVSNADLAQSEIAQIIPAQPRPKNLHELLADRLANYSLSATHLTNFLDLSRDGLENFIEDCLVRFPQPESEVLCHGNAMHAAMELAQIQTTNNTFDIAAIKRLYEHELHNSNLTAATIQRLVDRAQQQLDLLFRDLGLQLDPTSKPEQSFSASFSSSLAMYGKIDRIDVLDDKTVRIIDYKSGSVIDDAGSRGKDTLLKQWRHRLQLGFYVLLLKQQKAFVNKHIQTQIIQLDAKTPDTLCLDYDISQEELEHIARLAHAAFTRIKNLDIPSASGYEPNLDGIRQFEQDLLQ